MPCTCSNSDHSHIEIFAVLCLVGHNSANQQSRSNLPALADQEGFSRDQTPCPKGHVTHQKSTAARRARQTALLTIKRVVGQVSSLLNESLRE